MVRTSRSTTATRAILGFVLGSGVCLMTGALAFAEPNVKVTERSYIVDATTTQGLIFQMSTRGPLGFWAFTRTNVAWRGQCEVTVKIRHTLPVHSRPDQMPPDVRSDWERMTTALRRHEEKHGQHAINAGREIEQAGCVGGIATLRKWRGPDRALDARTNHGRTEGVFLQ